MAGTIVADTLTHSTAGSLTTDYVVNGSAKAWVFGDYSASFFVSNSLNVSSGTDHGTGDMSYALTNAFDASDYASLTDVHTSGLNHCHTSTDRKAAGTLAIETYNSSNTQQDKANYVCGLGDLA